MDTVRFITSAFSKERHRYVYTGGRRLTVTEEARRQMLSVRHSDYRELTIDINKRMHWERLHGKGGPYASGRDGGAYPAVRFRNPEEKTVETVSPISYYSHEHYTSDVSYTFNPDFLDRHDRFRHGYRDICVDALNCLSGRYARLFFCYLSAELHEFHFSPGKLRELLNIEDKYRKPSSVKLILDGIRNEFKKLDLYFDYALCTRAEWEERCRKHVPDGLFDNDGPKAAVAGKSQPQHKNKPHTRNFWFRIKGMDKYRIPKGVKSVFSTDAAGNPHYRTARTFLNRDMKMKDEYFLSDWEYIKRYVDKWGVEGSEKSLINFASRKMKEMSAQKKKPNHPKRVLLSLIRNAVKALDRSAAPVTGENPYVGKSPAEAIEMIVQKFNINKIDSS